MKKTTSFETRRSLLKATAIAALAPSIMLQPAVASTYPPNTVTMMVPYPAGGPSDVAARILAGPVGEALGAHVIVENVGGATGTIAASRVLAAKADGGIFFQGTQNELIIPPLTNKAVRFQPDAFENLLPISFTPIVLLVRADLPVNTMEEFFEYAATRNETNSLTYGSVGVGSLYHLITDYMGKRMDIPFTHVPYTGTAPVVQALIGQQIDFSLMPFQASMLEMVKGGRFKALAVVSSRKPAVLDGLPSLSNMPQLADFDFASYAGYFVKKGTPVEIKEKLNKAIGSALLNDEVVARLEAEGRMMLKPVSLEEAAKAYEDEVARYRDLIRVTGYTQEG